MIAAVQVPEDRLVKLQRLQAAGVEPYPAGGRLEGRRLIADLLAEADPDAPDGERVVATLAGRVASLRDHGSSLFADLKDQSGRVQVYLRKKALGPELFALFKETLDLGDFLACRGELGRTRMGEVTLFVDEAELLTKSMVAPPGEWYGLQDVETRLRRRYVDLMANAESVERFRARSAIVADVRRFLLGRDFMEVETPMLHAIAGGAAAKPFLTHHNTLDLDLFLRIAPELHLKRLLVGGFEKVFEIGRNFRNEGISPRHNPEFTMMEAYWAYARMDDWLESVEELVAGLARDHGNHTRVTGEGEEQTTETLDDHLVLRGDRLIDFSRPFARRTYAELVQEHAGVDVSDEAAVREAAKRQQIEVEGRSLAKVIDDLFGDLVEPHLVAPTFVTDFPLELSPLSKARPDDPSLAERFELFVDGMELANAFSELNDPADQLARFEEQVAQKDPELPGEVDQDYVDALQHGMPPAAGIGVGIDRLVMLLTGAETIRDVILFPLLRPKAEQGEEGDAEGPAADEDADAAGAGAAGG